MCPVIAPRGHIHLDDADPGIVQVLLGIGGTELPGAVRAGRRLVRLAPFRESGHLVLMQALAREGNEAEALKVYADLQVLLREELGVSPGATIQRVFEGLLRG